MTSRKSSTDLARIGTDAHPAAELICVKASDGAIFVGAVHLFTGHRLRWRRRPQRRPWHCRWRRRRFTVSILDRRDGHLRRVMACGRSRRRVMARGGWSRRRYERGNDGAQYADAVAYRPWQESVLIAEAAAEHERLTSARRAVVEPGRLVLRLTVETVVGIQLTVGERNVRHHGRRHWRDTRNCRQISTFSVYNNYQ